MLVCEWCSIFFYLGIFLVGLSLQGSDTYHDLTIYEQGVQDWRSNSWIDFRWEASNTGCAGGYEAVGNVWLGTVEGNMTADGVIKTDP